MRGKRYECGAIGDNLNNRSHYIDEFRYDISRSSVNVVFFG